MARQLRGKFIKSDAIDGSKIKLLQGQSIRGTDSQGNEVELVKLGAQGETLIAGVESASKSALDQEILDRQSGDSNLQSQIDTEKGRVDAILSASEADKDTFAEIVSLINSVDTENDSAFAGYVLSNDAAVGAVEDRLDLVEPKIDTLEGEMDAVESGLSQEILDRQAAITATEGLISDEESRALAAEGLLSDRISPMEEILEFEKAVVYNDNAQVYADAQPGSEDAAQRPGWYFKNTVAGQKVNWYFFDGINQANISLGDFSAYAVMTFDSVSPVRHPILAVYTMPTGTNDVMPGFAHSRMVYSSMSPTPVAGKKYLVYFGQNPAIHPELPRIQLAISTSNSIGEKLPTERVLTASFGSNSGDAVNTTQFLVESLGINSPDFKAEAELKIKVASLTKMDSLTSRVETLENAEPEAIVYVEDESHTMTTELSFVDLDFEASAIMKVTNGRANLFKGYDYTVSVVSGKTRLTFIGPSAQGGDEAIEANEVITASYIKA